jgi:hypothetical protein
MLKTPSITAPLALLAAFTFMSTPSYAQEREHGRRNSSGQESNGRTSERAQPRAQAPAQAPPRQPQAQSQRERVEGPRVERRRDTGGERAVPRAEVIAPRYGQVPDRRYGHDPDRRYDHVPDGRYAPRYEPRYAPRYYAPRYYSPRYGVGVRNYYRPYLFRPRVSIGLGLFMGYPEPYAYSYPYPITVYGYQAPAAPVVVGPGSPYYGGVALEITPYDADVYVDGSYTGRVEDFDGSSQPLTLAAGTHRIEIQAPGYAPLVVDVAVQAGQIIPYRGDLQPY